MSRYNQFFEVVPQAGPAHDRSRQKGSRDKSVVGCHIDEDNSPSPIYHMTQELLVRHRGIMLKAKRHQQLHIQPLLSRLQVLTAS